MCRGGVEDTRLEAKDSPFEDRPFRGQGQKCPKPRTKNTGASVLQKEKVFKKLFRRSPTKKGLQNFFQAFSKKKVFNFFFQAIYKILTIQKILLSSNRGQGSFRGLEASSPRPRTWPSRPRTSKCVLEAKNVLEDSISVNVSNSDNTLFDER